jgi:hypothetical protein
MKAGLGLRALMVRSVHRRQGIPNFRQAAMTLTEPVSNPPQRLVLVDFDWADVDLLPELFSRPEIAIRLVAGESREDIGLRVAELCDLPRTIDLADLTREIFDVALVSERSPRRTQIEGLLLALGTPCMAPRAFVEGQSIEDEDRPAIEAPLALHAAAFETTLGGGDFDDIVRQTLPDVGDDAPTAPAPVRRTTRRSDDELAKLDQFPSLEDRRALEQALEGLIADTGAASAVLQAGRDGLQVVAKVGAEDALLAGLITLALELNTPQVVSHLTGPNEGKAWGAWPFRTTRSRGVLAAAAIDPAEGWTRWEQTLEELRNTWDERDRAQAGPAFPMMPEESRGWLDREAFEARLALAVERNGRDGLRFAVHRLLFDDPAGTLEDFAARLPGQLRDTDCLCRPSPEVILLLTTNLGRDFDPLRRRLNLQWEELHRQRGVPAPEILKRSLELTASAEAESFLASARAWLASH